MERKRFLAAAVGAATAVVATGIAAAAAPPVIPPPTMAPRPYPTPSDNQHWERNQRKSDRNIMRVRKHLEHVIDELQHDQRDYDGHREKALDLLTRARTELLAAEEYDRSHQNA